MAGKGREEMARERRGCGPSKENFLDPPLFL